MRHARHSLVAMVLIALAAGGCAPEATTPSQPAADLPSGLSPSASSAEVENLIRGKLTQFSTLVAPDNTAFQALFTNIVSAMADETRDVGTHLDALLQFIDNHAGDAGEGTPLATLRDEIIALLYTFVGLDPDATICVLPAGHPSSVCVTPNPNGIDNAGFVYFPPAIFEELTFVSIKALQNSVGSGLDEYGYTLQIQTAPVSDFPGERPTVVACVPTDTPVEVLNRLLLGHRRDPDKYGGEPPFSLLPEQDLTGETELNGYAEFYCGTPAGAAGAGGPTVFGLAVDSPLNRFLVSARDLLVPSPLHASDAVLLASRTFSGASGSPEEFSTFRAVDRGVTGAGGSPEEFAPQAAGDPTGELQTGEAGTSTTVGLPGVVVQTVGGLGVNGVRVTFSLQAPTSTDGEGNLLYPASEASLCDGYDYTVETGGTGENGAPSGVATLPCINFGTKAGFANLRVTFDPTEVLLGDGYASGEELCMIGGDGACDNSVTQNFLIETVAGPAAQIDTYMPSSAPAIAATYNYGNQPEGEPVADPPQVIVRDAYGNPVGAGVAITWSPLLASNGAVLVPGDAALVTSASGTAQVTSWTPGLGANSVIAQLAALGELSPSATFTASVPTGQTVFACALGGNKTDLGLLRIPRSSNQTMRTLSVYLSVTGQASAMTTYPATVRLFRDNKGAPGAQVGAGAGGVTLPGNNGSPTAVTFVLTDPVLSGETSGSGTVWIEILVQTPSQRKIQVWHSNATFKNNDPCKSAQVYAPGSTTSFKTGLSIVVTN